MFWLTENIFTANIKKKYISHYSVEASLYDDVSQIRPHFRTRHFTLKANKQVSAAQVGGGEGGFPSNTPWTKPVGFSIKKVYQSIRADL